LYMAPVFAALFAVFLVLFRIIEHKASLLRKTSELYPVREIITYIKLQLQRHYPFLLRSSLSDPES
jgi:hypothetical protein